VSKIVGWGHWLVGALFALYGVLLCQSVFYDVGAALNGSASFYPAYLDGFRGAAFLLCAWGIVKWQYWGHRIGILLLMVEFVVWMSTTALGSMIDYDPHVWDVPLAMTPVLVWLLVPPVRLEYLRRDQIA
jgi:hypothetical protein